jgi:hypothetical protein
MGHLVVDMASGDLLRPPPDGGWEIAINSVSPEFRCSTADSGINRAFAAAAAAVGVDMNALLTTAREAFEHAQGIGPTYGDVVATVLPSPIGSIAVVLHALGPDCSRRDKRPHVLCLEPKGELTQACVFAAYLRAFLLAAKLAQGPTTLATVQLATGVFAADPGLCADALALAARACEEVRAATGRGDLRRIVVMVSEQPEDRERMAAALDDAAQMDSQTVGAAVTRLLFGAGNTCLLAQLPVRHTEAHKELGIASSYLALTAPFEYRDLSPTLPLAELLTHPSLLHFDW